MKIRGASFAAALWAGAAVVLCAAAQANPGGARLGTGATAARPPIIPIELFAEPDVIASPTLSPDGTHVAAQVRHNDKTGVSVMDAMARTAVASAILSDDLEYNWHRWAGPDIVLISVSQMLPVLGEETRVSRLLGMRVSTQEKWVVGPKAMGVEGDDLLHVADDGSSVLLSFQKSVYDWPTVTRVSLLDPKDRGQLIQREVDGIWEWYADDQGVVRMGTGWTGGKLRVTYRRTATEKFREIARIGEDDKDKVFDVARIVGGSNEAYILKNDDAGRRGLVRYDLASRQSLETVYRNADWDLTDAWLDEAGKPLAADYTDDRDRRVWFDPTMAKLQQQLETALKADEVWVGSRSKDNSRMLVYAGGESNPGQLFVYDATRRALQAFATFKPKLNIAHLARPKPIAYTARDGSRIAGYLTLPQGREPRDLPLIIMPHGGPYGVRDKLRYDDEVQFLANRGYAVLQPNYRGSGGYGGDFEKKGDGQIGRAMQDDIDDAMDWAVDQGIAARDRVCVVGASYGGYAAMWSVIRNPERYRCAASFAGVTDWKRMLKYDAKYFSRKGAKKWSARVSGEKEFDLDTMAPARTIDQLKRPLLVAHGKRDTNVPFSQYKLLMAQAQQAGVSFDPLVFDEAGHGLDKPEDKARWFASLEAFLAKHNPAS